MIEKALGAPIQIPNLVQRNVRLAQICRVNADCSI